MRGVLIVAALLLAGPALASTTTIGNSPESRACYLAAETRDVKDGLRHCDAAIAEGALANLAANHVNRGILLTWARRYRAALADFDRALALSPRQPEAFANRGNVHLMRGHLKMAIADYTQAIEGGCPKLFVVYYARGLAYEKQDRVAAAIEDFRKALALNPNFAEAREALAFYRALA